MNIQDTDDRQKAGSTHIGAIHFTMAIHMENPTVLMQGSKECTQFDKQNERATHPLEVSYTCCSADSQRTCTSKSERSGSTT